MGLGPDRSLVLVVVIAVGGVAVTVMQVVHVVAVRDRYVAAAFTMGVVGVLMVLGGLALIPVAIMLTVNVALVEIVGVVTVREGNVAAIGAMGVGMVFVGVVGHDA